MTSSGSEAVVTNESDVADDPSSHLYGEEISEDGVEVRVDDFVVCNDWRFYRATAIWRAKLGKGKDGHERKSLAERRRDFESLEGRGRR